MMSGLAARRPVSAVVVGAVIVLALTAVGRSEAGFTASTGNAANHWATAAVFPTPVALAVGSQHACAVDVGGLVWCWGSHAGGANGGDVDRPTPQRVIDGFGAEAKFIDVAAGNQHTCALTVAGEAWCWGENNKGEHGTGTSGPATSTPHKTRSVGEPLVSLTAGRGHTCAIDAGGGAWCWGLNTQGQLGDGSTTTRYAPVAVSTLGNAVTDISGGDAHSCAVSTHDSTHRRVWCWGLQTDGRLGNGVTTASSVTTPVAVTVAASGGMGGAIGRVTAGARHSCALQATGKGWCWGSGQDGRLGLGTTASHATPQPITTTPSDLTLAAIEAGDTGTCGAQTDGTPWCWGANSFGQIGDGPNAVAEQSPSDSTPRLVPKGVTRTHMFEPTATFGLGDSYACAVAKEDVWCWGQHTNGRLGIGPSIDGIYDYPRPVTLGSN